MPSVDMLHTDPVNSDITALPSPEQLKGKILIKVSQLSQVVRFTSDLNTHSLAVVGNLMI